MHIHHHHSRVVSDSETEYVVSSDYCAQNCAENNSLVSADISYFNSMFAVSLQGRHNIPDSSIDSIVASTAALVENHVNNFADQIKERLITMGVDTSVLDEFSVDHQLQNFNTAAKRIKQCSNVEHGTCSNVERDVQHPNTSRVQ